MAVDIWTMAFVFVWLTAKGVLVGLDQWAPVVAVPATGAVMMWLQSGDAR